MTGLLLDTNALLWVLSDDSHLGPEARKLLGARVPVHFSPVSVLEIAIKELLGRLHVPGDVAADAQGVSLVEFRFRAHHSSGVAQFPTLARHDSFDRMLLSQARLDGLSLLTSDRHLLDLGLDCVISARR